MTYTTPPPTLQTPVQPCLHSRNQTPLGACDASRTGIRIGTASPPCSAWPLNRMRTSMMSWPEVRPLLAFSTDALTIPFPAQKRLRDLKARISAQSKKNFVLERDVRFLDSRIALLIQNRMALDEVSPTSCCPGQPEFLLIGISSKTRSNDTLKTLIQKKATSPTTEKFSNIPTSSSFSSQNPVTSPPYAVSSACPKSIPSSRLSCSRYTETNTRVAKSTCY